MFILAGSDVYTAVLLSRPADRVRVWNTVRAASADIDGHQKRVVCISCNTERILDQNRLKILLAGPRYSPRLHYELNSCGGCSAQLTVQQNIILSRQLGFTAMVRTQWII